MSRRKSKTLTQQQQSFDSDVDVEISVQLSPQLKRTCLPLKHWPTSQDWQKCADSFSGLDPLPERGKKRKRQCIQRRPDAGQKLNNSQVAKDFDSGNEEIVWNSSDEEVSSSQSTVRQKSIPQLKVRRQILPRSTLTAWPSEFCNNLSKRNNRNKMQTSNEKIPSEIQELRWHRLKDVRFSRKLPQLHPDDEEINLEVQEFEDSDEEFISKRHEKSMTIGLINSDEELPIINSSSSDDEQPSDSCSRSDVDISTWSSSNFSGDGAGTTIGGWKTSEWLQALQMATPTKNQDNSASSSQQETSNLFDSAKKKRRHKYSKDGLALKLSRIISREKTALNVWSYRQSDVSNEPKNIITACVHSFISKVGLVITLCSFGTLSPQNVWTAKNTESFQTVLFHRNILEVPKLRSGSIIRIFPPWQELLVPETGEKVLLCTYYCQLIEHIVHIWDMMDNPCLDLSQVVCHSFQWNCPCSISDGLLKSCPASTCPVLTKCPKIQSSFTRELPVSKRTSHQTTSSLNIIGLTTEDVTTVGGNSTILSSIQAAPTSFQQGLSFQAMVLRIFCAQFSSKQAIKKKQRQSLQSWSVLVEDSQGTVCIVHLSKEKHGSKNDLSQLIQSMEGETWNFFGLRVFNRSNRHKDPALFSMIDKVWIDPPLQNELPKSSNSSDKEVAAQVKPGFCYVTGPSGDVGVESGVLPSRNSFISVEPAAQAKLMFQISSLKEINQQQDKDAKRMRITFIAKIFYFRSKFQIENQSVMSANAKTVLFLSDPSVIEESYGQNYLTIHCLPSCYLPSNLTIATNAALVLMRDVLVEQDMIAFADNYTRIWPWPPPAIVQSQIVPSISNDFVQQCSDLFFPLQSLQEDSQCNSLFKVQGVIYSVDHKTALTWETCPYCDEEQLAFTQDEKQDRFLVCLNCDVKVAESVTHMNLEVIIRCLSLPGHCEVRVNLLQSTVESLLPNGDHKDGYDVAAILGQQVGPLPCLLIKKQNTSQQQQQQQQHPVYYLEEIQPI